MGHRIVLDEITLEQEFQNMLDEMYMMYHYHQSNTPHFDDKTNSETIALNYIGFGGGGSSSRKTGSTPPPMVQYRGSWYYKGANGKWTPSKTYIHSDGIARAYPQRTSSNVGCLLVALLILGLLAAVMISYGVVHAAPVTMGDPPYPVRWQAHFLEFYWPGAAINADSYDCAYDLYDDQGTTIRRYANSWLVGAGGVFVADDWWDFEGRLWFVTNIYCNADFSGNIQVSPRNLAIYRMDFRHLVFVPMVRRR